MDYLTVKVPAQGGVKDWSSLRAGGRAGIFCLDILLKS